MSWHSEGRSVRFGTNVGSPNDHEEPKISSRLVRPVSPLRILFLRYFLRLPRTFNRHRVPHRGIFSGGLGFELNFTFQNLLEGALFLPRLLFPFVQQASKFSQRFCSGV